MERLLVTGYGRCGTQLVCELQQKHPLACGMEISTDGLASGDIATNTAWIIVSSWADVLAMEKAVGIQLPDNVILIAFPLLEDADAEVLQAYNSRGVHVVIPVAVEKHLEPASWPIRLLVELFAFKWATGVIQINLMDVQELLLTSSFLYFGESGKDEAASNDYHAICLACKRAFPKHKIEQMVHVFVLLEGKFTDIISINRGIEQIGIHCDNYFVTLSICETDIDYCHAVIFAGVQK